MADHKEKERLEALRERLYERGQDANFVSVRHGLSTDGPQDVARGWAGVAPAPRPKPAPAPAAVAPRPHTKESTLPVSSEYMATPAESGEEAGAGTAAESIDPMTTPKRRRTYRTYILLATLAVFVLVVGASSVYLFFGGNQISGKNIDFVVTGPLAVAGGDVLSLQVAVNNNNAVAIEGATLIVNYPAGTKSVEENPRDLYEERISLETIDAGEAKTIPLQAAVFGEENEEKSVSVAIEYRVIGSNGTFFKEAEPLKFTINSSPVVLRVESIEKVSSGQEFEMKLVVESNAQTPLKNVLISATYPDSFRFVRSTPEPSYRQNEWVIADLAAKSRQEITVRGVATGLSSESFIIRFQAGTPRSDNQFIIGSVLAQTAASFTVEQPFVGLDITINSETDGDVVLAAGSPTLVTVRVTNTHSEPVYDMNLRIVPTGTAFRESQLQINDGFYDSVNKTLRWEVSGKPDLAKVLPGEQREFTFQLGGASDAKTATLDLDVSVYARRVSENNVAEELIGASDASVRYASMATLGRQIDHLTGPVPPVVNKETLYTLTVEAAAGANDLSGAVLTTTLPQYVRYLDVYDGPGSVSFNPINKELRWTIGEIKGDERKSLSFQVAFTPSVLQVGSTPVMMNRQQFQATDRFTGTSLQAEGAPITTEMSREAGYDRNNGVVAAEESEDN